LTGLVFVRVRGKFTTQSWQRSHATHTEDFPMRPEDDGIWLRSRPMTYVAGQNIPVELNFLAAANGFNAPEVAEFALTFSGSVTAGAGGQALGRDFAKLIAKLQISDGELIVDASGAALRPWVQSEWGSVDVDPADVGTSATNASYEAILSLPFEPPKSLQTANGPRNTRIPLVNLLESGRITISNPGTLPTNWSSVTLTMELLTRVVEGRVKQANSRLKIWEQNVTNQEYYYDVGGSIRYAGLTSALTTTGYTTLAGFTSLNSRSLSWEPNFHPRTLRDRYRRQQFAVSSADEHLLSAPGAIPLVQQDRYQKIGAMPMLDKLHLNLGAAAPTNGVLLLAAIIDRPPRLAARALGYTDVNAYIADVRNFGYVMDGNPGGSRVVDFDPKLANKLPLRIKSA
jgi:hypothetical protein